MLQLDDRTLLRLAILLRTCHRVLTATPTPNPSPAGGGLLPANIKLTNPGEPGLVGGGELTERAATLCVEPNATAYV